MVYFFYHEILKHSEESGVFYTGLSLRHWNCLSFAVVPGLYIYWFIDCYEPGTTVGCSGQIERLSFDWFALALYSLHDGHGMCNPAPETRVLNLDLGTSSGGLC